MYNHATAYSRVASMCQKCRQLVLRTIHLHNTPTDTIHFETSLFQAFDQLGSSAKDEISAKTGEWKGRGARAASLRRLLVFFHLLFFALLPNKLNVWNKVLKNQRPSLTVTYFKTLISGVLSISVFINEIRRHVTTELASSKQETKLKNSRFQF